MKLYTPDFDWLVTPAGNRLHHADLSRKKARECEYWGGLHDETVKLDCGRTASTVLIPGLFSRGLDGGGVPRCRRCCDATGLPYGNGSPKNDDECRRLLGMETS